MSNLLQLKQQFRYLHLKSEPTLKSVFTLNPPDKSEQALKGTLLSCLFLAAPPIGDSSVLIQIFIIFSFWSGLNS